MCLSAAGLCSPRPSPITPPNPQANAKLANPSAAVQAEADRLYAANGQLNAWDSADGLLEQQAAADAFFQNYTRTTYTTP